MLRKVLQLMLWGLVFAPGALLAAVPLMVPYSGTVQVGGEAFNGAGQFKFAIVNQACALAGQGCASVWSNDGTSNGGGEPANGVAVTVNQGKYSVKLGDAALVNMTGIPAAVFSDDLTYLRVWFSDGATGFQLLTPDRQLISVPYAYRADSADHVAAGSVGAAQIKDSEVQKRVAQKCSGGDTISSINADGTVVCEPDDGQLYTPGAGISIVSGTIGIADNGVTDIKLAANSVTSGKLADGSVALSKLAPGSVDDTKVANVGWSKLTGVPSTKGDPPALPGRQ